MSLSRYLHLLALLVAVVFGVACGVSSSPSSPSGSVEVVTSALGVEDVASVTLTMTRAEPAPAVTRTTTLLRSGDQWRAIVGDLVLGTWTFDAAASDAVGSVIFRAHAEGIAIDGAAVPTVLLVFQPAVPPVPYENTAPLIDAIALSSRTVIPSQTIRFQATAHDPNVADTLTYAWDASAGTLSRTTDTSNGGPATIATEWTAPPAAGEARITLTVRDQKGLEAAITFTLIVMPTTGTLVLDVAFNHVPTVDSLVSTSDQPIDAVVNPTTSITVTASDLDGQRLRVVWSAENCTGTFTPASADLTAVGNSQTSTVTFTRTDRGASQTCDIIATVSDGDVANTGTLFLATRGEVKR